MTSGSDGLPPGIILGGESRLAAYPRREGCGDGAGRDGPATAGMMEGGARRCAAYPCRGVDGPALLLKLLFDGRVWFGGRWGLGELVARERT